MENSIVIIFNIVNRNISVDIEIPLDITTRDLIFGLNNAYDLGIDISDIQQCHLSAENPITLLRGNELLKDYELRNGSVINYSKW